MLLPLCNLVSLWRNHIMCWSKFVLLQCTMVNKTNKEKKMSFCVLLKKFFVTPKVTRCISHIIWVTYAEKIRSFHSTHCNIGALHMGPRDPDPVCGSRSLSVDHFASTLGNLKPRSGSDRLLHAVLELTRDHFDPHLADPFLVPMWASFDMWATLRDEKN